MSCFQAMELTINGEAREVPAGLTVEGLLRHLALTGDRVAVEVNRQLVRRAERPAHTLRAGDAVEIVTFVGGG